MNRSFDPRINLRYRFGLWTPFGYSNAEKKLYDLTTWLLVHYHPEYIRRLVNWLDAQDGAIGVGGGWRAGGAQPDKQGFAEEGRSFHQNQNFNDGFTGAAAVDLVARATPLAISMGHNNHRSPRWSEVPAQGSADATKWGVHCNVGTPNQIGSEPWHMQPVIPPNGLDGWQTWRNLGRPSPARNYPIPNQDEPTPPDPTPDPPDEDDDMAAAKVYIGRSNSGPHKGMILKSLGLVICSPVSEGAERGLDNLIRNGLLVAINPQTGEPLTSLDDAPLLGGAWVRQMGSVVE